ncbi:hypothetical protein [Paraburkholderia youngii]|uniref:Uncharacterized protein n=1 Tax=Paraburkholderia youngii TaxID=2782701 RepID=A0A7Y6N2K6_9BURK|nr:hypothetical protein [Paraburkholderia youngii]NUY05162.1 hypothetical protein [Paraburkholderia youngii]
MFVLSPFAAYLLKKTMTLPEHAGVSAVEQMHWAWAALVTLTSFWWAAASFGLKPPTFVILHNYYFRFARYGFLELTMVSQAFTLLLLAPSFRAALGALLFGTIPFAFNMAPLLFIYRPGDVRLVFGSDNWLLRHRLVRLQRSATHMCK